jgi:hypothetical protein
MAQPAGRRRHGLEVAVRVVASDAVRRPAAVRGLRWSLLTSLGSPLSARGWPPRAAAPR